MSQIAVNNECEIPPLLGSTDGQCDKAGQCKKAACAHMERAIELRNDVFKSKATDLVPRKSNLFSLGQAKSISSPFKDSLSGMMSPKEDPNYHTGWTDMSGTHWIQFKPVTTDMDVFVPGEELVQILNYGVAQNGKLLPPTWSGVALEPTSFGAYSNQFSQHILLVRISS